MIAHNFSQQMQDDISKARQAATFPVMAMSYFIWDGRENFETRRKIGQIMANEPVFDQLKLHFMERQEHVYNGILVAKRMIELKEKHQWSDKEFNLAHGWAEMLSPFGLHYEAFMPVIQSMGTPDQRAKWLDLAAKHAIIGCYAQTELGHGSNVAGLLTRATFDPATDEFVIHTPDLTGAKWWIGGLGVLATHAVVQAQLVIGSKSYGPHIFIVPIRSPGDHRPVKGVTVGDIGPKAYGGFAAQDNGYALFDHVRIPRDNMLMGLAKVTREGQYIPAVHDKLSYGSMVKLRVDIAHHSAIILAKAVTIAIRYCTVRRQFHPRSRQSNDSQTLENQVISYSSVQHRLFPLVATAYALYVAAKDQLKDYKQMMLELQQGNARMLPELHATACALKVWSARKASEGAEECRRAMGGHGYSAFSGVSFLFANSVPANTYEGDNYVLVQQTARFLLKQLQRLSEGHNVSAHTASYLKNPVLDGHSAFVINDANTLFDSNIQLNVFGTRAARLVHDLSQQLLSNVPWADLNMECWEVATAHAEYIIMGQMIEKTNALQAASDPLAPIFKQMTNLLFLSLLSQSSLSSFLSTGTIEHGTLNLIRKEYRALIASFAKEVVALTDAFDFSDSQLGTVLGREDGRAYEGFWEMVQNNPLNSDENREKFSDLVKQVLHRNDNLSLIQKAKL